MKVLFIDSVHPILKERLICLGCECDEFPKKSHEELKSILPNYEGLVIRSKFKFTKEVFDSSSRLKWIARSGAGMENIDTEYAKIKKVVCFNSPEGNRDAVGEQALGMLLALMNNLRVADKEVRNGIWEREGNRGHEIKGKTVGIIGYGNMGKAFAQRLLGFECNVIAYDKYQSDFSDQYAKEVSLKQLYNQSDIVSLHTPLTKETHHLINDEYLSQFKKDIYFINTARGKSLKTSSLTKGLKSGRILGACLDVLEFEAVSFEKMDFSNLPSEMQYLIESDKVILSPHIAGWTHESYYKLSSSLADKIESKFFH